MKAPNFPRKYSLQLGVLTLPELVGLELHWGYPQLHYPLNKHGSTVKRNKSKSYTIKITSIMKATLWWLHLRQKLILQSKIVWTVVLSSHFNFWFPLLELSVTSGSTVPRRWRCHFCHRCRWQESPQRWGGYGEIKCTTGFLPLIYVTVWESHLSRSLDDLHGPGRGTKPGTYKQPCGEGQGHGHGHRHEHGHTHANPSLARLWYMYPQPLSRSWSRSQSGEWEMYVSTTSH